MLLEATSAPSPAPPRRWHPPDRVSCVPEPGRLATNALVNVARHARGCETAGDDRLETRAYAVKRLLHRWSRAQRSARFACSVAQLVAALAPIMGWARPPADRLERERWVGAHRKSVQRWLDDLQAAGLLVYDGERDNRGQLWRTVITLLPAPQPPDSELQVARRRLRAFKRRSRRRHGYRSRRSRERCLRRSHARLEAILAASARPQRATRARLARRRACALHERRRRAAVDAQLAARDEHNKDLTHPFGAPTTSENSPVIREAFTEPRPPNSERDVAQSPVQALTESPALAAESSARARETVTPSANASEKRVSTDDEEAGTPPVDPFAGVDERVAARYAATAWRRHEAARQALQRAQQVATDPAERPWGLGRLREAWVVFRFGTELRASFTRPESGPERVGDHGATDAGARWPGQLGRAARAIALYEQFAEQRPPGWPAAGAGALCALAAQQLADSFEGDIARLRLLAKDMRAAALHADAQRLQRARRRAERRHAPGQLRFSFRIGAERPRWETPELRRRRVRDELLRAGEHPGLSPNAFYETYLAGKRHDAGQPRHGDPVVFELPDGLTARAERYRRELAEGRWTLPDAWPNT